MRNHRVITPFVLLIIGALLNAGATWTATTDAAVTIDEKSVAGAPAPPISQKEDHIWAVQKGLGWETRFFDRPLTVYNFTKGQFHLPSASGIPLKSPGRFPGIEFGLEMNSFQALQQVVPPERWSKSLNSEQNLPIFLSPTTHSPDYNGGFLRFTW